MNAHEQLNALRIPHATFDIILSAVWLDVHICSITENAPELCTVYNLWLYNEH